MKKTLQIIVFVLALFAFASVNSLSLGTHPIANSEIQKVDFDDCGEPEFVHTDFDDCGEPEFVHTDFDDCGEPEFVHTAFNVSSQPGSIQL